MVPYRVVFADDHVLFREGLKSILGKVSDLEVIGEADNGLELLRLLRKLTPHLVVLDISMPGLRGIEAIHEIKAKRSHVKVLMLTMHKDIEYIRAAICAGADGYLLKEDAVKQLLYAIETIRRGEIYLSPRISPELMHDWRQICRGEQTSPADVERLTNREREILKLTAEGRSSKEIGDLLTISNRTVEHHRANIMVKLNLKNTADLVKYAIFNKYL